jgi:hypothetical protein
LVTFPLFVNYSSALPHSILTSIGHLDAFCFLVALFPSDCWPDGTTLPGSPTFATLCKTTSPAYTPIYTHTHEHTCTYKCTNSPPPSSPPSQGLKQLQVPGDALVPARGPLWPHRGGQALSPDATTVYQTPDTCSKHNRLTCLRSASALMAICSVRPIIFVFRHIRILIYVRCLRRPDG